MSTPDPPKESITLLGTPERNFNPLRKLISGFCDPFIPKHDDDDRTVETLEDSSQTKNTTITKTTTTTTTHKVGHETKSKNLDTISRQVVASRDVTSKTIQVTTTKGNPTEYITPVSNDKATRSTSELTIDSVDTPPNENTPEIQMSKQLTRQRRRYALQVFTTSILFVMATMMILTKLGYLSSSVTDFQQQQNMFFSMTSSSSPSFTLPSTQSWGNGWIRISNKEAINTSIDTQATKITNEIHDESSTDESFHGEKNDEIFNQHQQEDVSETSQTQAASNNKDVCENELPLQQGNELFKDESPKIAGILQTDDIALEEQKPGSSISSNEL